MVFVDAFFFELFPLSSSNKTKVTRAEGNEETFVHDLPPCAPRQRPSTVVPISSVSVSFGSTWRRSPVERPSWLPPSLNGRVILSQDFPRFSEIINVALGAHDSAY